MTNNQLATQTKRNITTDPSLLTGADIKSILTHKTYWLKKQVGQALALCKGRNLNPFANEVYIVAYTNRNGAKSLAWLSLKRLLKRAAQCKDYEGFEAGVVAVDSEGVMHERKGAIMLPGDTLIGGWARVHRKNFKVPVEIFVSREEYDKKQSTWNTMPATMIRKVALVNALREAFPEDLGNMYTEDDGGETFDRIKDVTPQESREDVVARKMAEIEQFNKEQEANHADPEPAQTEESIQGELLDGELEY